MSKKKSIFYALVVMLLWGTLFPAVKLGYAAYNIVTVPDILLFAGVRFAVCGFVICLYSIVTNPKQAKVQKTDILPLLGVGLFAVILHYSFSYLGLLFTESSKTAIIKQIGPIFYVCFSFVFFKEDKFSVKKLVAAVMGFVGIIAINYGSGTVSFGIGEIFVLMASFCTVFSNVIGKRAFRSVSPVAGTGISQLFGGVVLLIAGICTGGKMSFSLADSGVFVYVCIASIISYCLWYTVVKSGELSKLFIIKFAEPVFACVFGAILLSEDIFKVQYLVAFLMIAGGIYISNKTKNT